MPRQAAQKQTRPAVPPREVIIPDKLYFRIGDVAKLLGVETYVLRFWETEFPQMRPNKSGTGQRLYRKRDVEQAVKVQRLLHEQGYTIAGARQLLAQQAAQKRAASQLQLVEKPAAPLTVEAKIAKLRAELKELLAILSAAPGRTERKPRSADGPGPRLFE
ncbi:MAG TPA: MerR family transcriptional regulator [Acidobacteriaceae bacterium]